MVTKTITLQMEGGRAVVDLAGWETASIQVINGGGTISLLGTNNAGDITGVTDGNAKTAANFNAVQAVNLSTGSAATAITGTILFRIAPIGFRFLQIGDGSTATADKVLVFVTKPY